MIFNIYMILYIQIIHICIIIKYNNSNIFPVIWTFIDLTRAIREGHIWIIYGLEPHLGFFPVTPQMRWSWQGLSNGVGPRCPSIHFLYQHGLPWMGRNARLNDSWNFDELEWASAPQTKRECCLPNSTTRKMLGQPWDMDKTYYWSQSSAHASMKTG